MRILPFAIGTFAIVACGAAAITEARNSQPSISSPILLIAAAASGVGAPVSAAEAAAIMKTRHDGMEEMGKAMKVLHRDLDSDDPNMGEIRSAAAVIYKNSKAASGWFPAGTGPEAGKTGAKPDIWQNPQDFAAKLAGLQHYAQQYYQASLAGDAGTLKANEDTISGACKACHDKYRMEMKH
jgi:cytochrome c556